MKDLELLGRKVQDNVTGFKGIVTSVSYDLYGCIMGLVTPEVDDKGKREDSLWMDTKRLQAFPGGPVMEVPTFGRTWHIRERVPGTSPRMADKVTVPGLKGPEVKTTEFKDGTRAEVLSPASGPEGSAGGYLRRWARELQDAIARICAEADRIDTASAEVPGPADKPSPPAVRD